MRAAALLACGFFIDCCIDLRRWLHTCTLHLHFEQHSCPLRLHLPVHGAMLQLGTMRQALSLQPQGHTCARTHAIKLAIPSVLQDASYVFGHPTTIAQEEISHKRPWYFTRDGADATSLDTEA